MSLFKACLVDQRLTVQEVRLRLVPLKLRNQSLDLLKVVQRVSYLAGIHCRHDVALGEVLFDGPPQLPAIKRRV